MKRKQPVIDDSSSDSDEEYYAEPKKQRHSTGSAFMNAFNAVLGDSIIIDNYVNSDNLPLGIKFKVVLRSFKQMTIIEKFFIFNKLHNVSYSTITEPDCIALLSLGFTQITDDEIENLQAYFRKRGKSSNYTDSKFQMFDFENYDTRLYWQLTYQTWVTFYHDMVDCYTTRHSSKNPNEIPTNFNETLDQISRDSNFYVKAIHIIRKKLRHIPGKTSGLQEMTKLYNNLNDVLSTMEEASMEKVDGIHMINEKVLSSNFFFHFLQTEEEKKSQLSTFLHNKARVVDYIETVKFSYPLTTKTSFSSIPVSILTLEKSIRFLNEFIKPREMSLIKSIRGSHIKAQFSNYGRKEPITPEEPATLDPSPSTTDKPKDVPIPSPEESITPQNTLTASSKESTTPHKNGTPGLEKQVVSTEKPTSSEVQVKPVTITSKSDNNPSKEQHTKQVVEPVPVIDLEDDKLDAASVFRNWWMGEYKNFDFSKHQAVLSAKRLLQFFSSAMREKDPTFHMDSSHTSWRVIRKAIEKGEIIGLRVDGEGRSFKVVNQ